MSRAQPPRAGEELLAPFRVLAGGEDLATAGAALLERACRALEAVEGVLLLEAGDGPAPGPGFAPGPRWGRHGPAGRLGERPGDRELAAGAATAGRPVLGAGVEVWCAMVVEGQAVGVLALRRAVRPFAGPDLAAVEVLATGGSAAAACASLFGGGPARVTLLSVVAAPEGIARLEAEHPSLDIVTAAVDERLNDQAYIVPGLGDFGDRLFGT